MKKKPKYPWLARENARLTLRFGKETTSSLMPRTEAAFVARHLIYILSGIDKPLKIESECWFFSWESKSLKIRLVIELEK